MANIHSDCFRVALSESLKMVNTKKVTPALPVPRTKGEKKEKLVTDDVKGSSIGKGKGCPKVRNT